jgi:D-alanine transaminase
MTKNNSRIVYLNGEFLPVEQAKVSVMDRGFLFADGVYEVVPLLSGRLVGLEGHMDRLRRSLAEIALPFEFDHEFFIDIFKTLLERNPGQGDNHAIYMQITRGAADARAHHFPAEAVQPTIFVQTTPVDMPSFETMKKGASAVTTDDARWNWCHIKSISLLPNVLSTQRAKEVNAKEAILIRDGKVMEGASSNVFVIKNGEILTSQATQQILRGITRDIVLNLAKDNNIPCREADISEDELYNADEVWVTSSTKEILPVVKINDHVIGSGEAGKVWHQLMDVYTAYKEGLPKL